MTEKKTTTIINFTKAELLYLFCLPKHILAAKAGSTVLRHTRLQLKQEHSEKFDFS